MRPIATPLICMLVLAASMAPVNAVSVETRLTPRSLRSETREFAVQVKETAGLTQFTVTLEARSQPHLPVRLARLDLLRDGAKVAAVPVEERLERGKVTCWFRVSPKMVAESRFEFSEYAAAVPKDAQGRPIRREDGSLEQIPLPGGKSYWFYLRDFAGSAAAPDRP